MEKITHKVCTTCHKKLPTTMYHKGKYNRDGHRTVCKACCVMAARDYNRTEDGRLRAIYANHRTLAKRNHLSTPRYALLGLTKWAEDRGYHVLWQEWVQANYIKSLTPCVARYDADVGYVLRNLYVTTFGKIVEDKYSPVRQYTKKGVFIEQYVSQKAAAEYTGINAKSISSCCLNNSASAGGFVWKTA